MKNMFRILSLASALVVCAHAQIFYSFNGSSTDGANPRRAVAIAPVSGTVYGTTAHGGPANGGNIFLLGFTVGFQYVPEHFFAGPPTDGADSDGDLLLASDNNPDAYGTTTAGGAAGMGTVFELTTTGDGYWQEVPLYSFTGQDGDGEHPMAGVIMDGGVLYGTTAQGGKPNKGTVYALAPNGATWTESVVYQFRAAPDGADPHAALLAAGNGVYYGATSGGGAYGFGTIFELTHTGAIWMEKTLYSFMGGSDGSSPQSAVIMDSTGALYGTTMEGGASGKGAVYKLSPGTAGAWTYRVLYSFGATAGDGTFPRAGVVFGDTQTVLYGATTQGGAAHNCAGGCGTVYQLALNGEAWTETVIHRFTGYPNDGATPYGNVTYAGADAYGRNYIWGSTYSGGSSLNCTSGCGTLYLFEPPSN